MPSGGLYLRTQQGLIAYTDERAGNQRDSPGRDSSWRVGGWLCYRRDALQLQSFRHRANHRPGHILGLCCILGAVHRPWDGHRPTALGCLTAARVSSLWVHDLGSDHGTASRSARKTECSAENACWPDFPLTFGTGKGSHTSSRTSVSFPVTAAAAAIAGLTRWVREPGP